MYPLETKIQSWRKEMQAAGIGPGERRDELESHLREGFEERVRAGMTDEAAFASAAGCLGQAPALKREYDLALTWQKHLWWFARQPIEFFPTNLRFTAWCSVLIAVVLIGVALQSSLELLGLGRSSKAGGQAILDASLTSIFFGLVSRYVFNASLSYLRRPAFPSALQLAATWVTIFWWAGSLLTANYLIYANRGNPIPVFWPLITSAIFIAVAAVMFRHWKRSLLAQTEADLIAAASPSLR